jgi:hypothetical protein
VGLLKRGADWLNSVFDDHVAESATYQRMALANQPATTVVVTPGETNLTVEDDSTVPTSFRSTDFIVTASLLTGWIESFEPMVGDLITFNGRVYEVQNIPGGRCFDWTDPNETAFRIHTKFLRKV